MEQETGFVPEEEASENEPTAAEIGAVVAEALGDQEAAGDFEGLDGEEAIGLAYTMLIEAGFDPPDKILAEKGIIQKN